MLQRIHEMSTIVRQHRMTALSLKMLLTVICSLAILHPDAIGGGTGLPAPGNNKVAYYVFDSGGPDHYPLTSFTDAANVVIIFEGTLWELADSVHYSSGWMQNVVYHSHADILRDVRILQARGVKVLMNVDDAASWSTTTPFTTYDGKKLTPQEFAAFMKACAIDSVHLDGISLDIEHKATGNATYINLLKEIGKYFGPLSANSTSQMYIAAIYAGGAPGSVVGKSRDITQYMNFVMDMAYFNQDYAGRFKQWADSIGASKTMIGVLNDMNTVSFAVTAAAWQPVSPPKAGIMVYAANNLKSYTDAVFNALVTAPGAATSPFPVDNAIAVSTTAALRWTPDPGATFCDVYFGTTNPPELMGNQADTVFAPGPLKENTTYYWRIDERNSAGTSVGPVWRFTTGKSNAVMAEGNAVPGESMLSQNYPNPFNPKTDIRFEIGDRGRGVGEPGGIRVTLKVYDLLGREVALLVDEEMRPGTYRVQFDASGLASGVYLYRLSTSSHIATKRMVLTR
jgi:hypothetical protein